MCANTYRLSVLLATIGSESLQCDQITGACTCKAGVGGLSCDHCQDFHYRFLDNGCRSVYSNQLGTLLEKLVCCTCPKIALESRLEQKNWGMVYSGWANSRYADVYILYCTVTYKSK